MITIKGILLKLLWLLRKFFGLGPRSVAEELWRSRQLRSSPQRQHGSILWQGKQLQYCDGRAVFDQLHDIFIKGAYDFTTSLENPRILDCGAHVGVAVIRWRQLFPNARITAFEADPTIAEVLRKNLRERGDPSEVHAAAAWCKDGILSFSADGLDSGHIDPNGKQTVDALALARFCSEPVDLLKLDIETAEGPVLAHLAEENILPRIRRIVCEWHEWGSEPSLHVALALLANAGFIYRISDAACLGERCVETFPLVAWPGNHLLIYAWRPDVAV